MKKRVLSMLLAFMLCFSTLPMTAFAQDADVVTEQEADSAEEQEEQQEAVPVTEQKEAEAAAAPETETPVDKSTTAEAPSTEESTAESVSDSDAGTQDTAADDEKKAAVQKVQALIDALPETVTEDNAESVGEQLEAIAEAMESLTEEQIAELDMEHLYAISEAMSAPMTVAEGEHRHPVCGETCTDGDGHEAVTWTPISELTNDMAAGNYYLTDDIILTAEDTKYGNWITKKDINLCLNGHTITLTDNQIVIWGNLSLCNCSSETKTVTCYMGIAIAGGGEFELYDNVQIKSLQNNGVIIMKGSKFTMYGGTISDCIYPAVDVDSSAIFEMKGGEIRNNSSSTSFYGGGVNVNGTFIVSGTAKVTGNTANGAASNVYLQSGAKMIVGDAGLKDGASIGVTLYKYPNDGGSVIIATGKIEGSSKYFSADAGDPYGVMEQDGALVLKNGVPHMHPVCGTTCEHGEKHDSVEWTGISSLNEITEDGNYYLKNDISDVGYYWKLKYDINLCLNGHSIKTDDNKDCYIDVNASNTLSLCNPHEKAASCIGVWVGDKCKFNLYGNVVITRKNNSGVWINDGGTFTMNGGTICNSGCGVVVDNNATFIMNNGRITENTMINYGGGGGVCVYAGGNFTMTGGEISKNTATAYGGGVYVDFNTSQLKSGTFTVSGNAKIIDNKVGNSTNNVALCDGSKITIAESGLGNDASIGVSLKKDITEGSYAVIASGANNSNADKITSDSSDYKIQKMGDELLLCTNSTTLHTHPVCGTNCTHTGDDAHSTLTWQGISALSEIKKSGNYYLKNDITLSEVWKVPYDINLCLNNHKIITKNYSDYYIDVKASDDNTPHTVSLCNPHEQKASCIGVIVENKCELNLYDNVEITRESGSGVCINDGSTFTMYGGTISNSKCGVAVNASTFIMNGGSITQNTIDTNGGGVCVENNGTFTMNGGGIFENKANDGNSSMVPIKYGCGVCVISGSTFTMNGGSIFQNTASRATLGGGVYVKDGTFTMTGGSISENKAKIGGGAYIDENGTFTITNSSICGNEANDDGGVCVDHQGSFIMKNSTISGNHSVNDGGGVTAYAYATLFSVSGSVKITENTVGGTLKNGVYTGATPSNVRLYNNGDRKCSIVTVEKSGLEEGSSIGISVSKTRTPAGMGEYVNIGVDPSGNNSKYFFADAGEPYCVTERKGGELVLVKGDLHEHPICGGICKDDENHSDITWKGISSLDEIKADGNYYLLNPLTLDQTWYCEFNVKLCLNGNTITGADGKRVIRVVKEKSLDITDCQATPGKITHAAGATGAGILVMGTLTLWNGNITGNTTVHDVGAGVFVVWTGTFNMKGGMISGNKITSDTEHGAGVYVGVANGDAKDGIFNMSGGTITGNTSAGTGGGVSMLTGTFTMTGGTITGNNSTGDEETQSGGVYVTGQAVMNVSGDVQITDNWRNGTWNEQTKRYEQGDNGTASNVCLSGTENEAATITVNEGLKQEARIGVIKSAANLPTTGNTVKIATGATDNALDYTEIFTSDISDGDYKVVKNGTDLYLNAHQHSWVYAANGAVITAKCSGCDAEGGSVTLKAPENLVYDGYGKTADMTFSKDWQGPAVVDDIPICYEKEDGTAFVEEPINVGTFVAKISIKNKSGEPATASVKYTILKAPLTVTAGNYMITYGENPEDAVEASATFEGFANDADQKALEFTPKYTYDYTQYGNVGNYAITPGVPDGLKLDEKLPNYDVKFVPGKLTVTPYTVILDWKNIENRTYGDGQGAIKGVVYCLEHDSGLVSAEIEGADLTAGTHTARVTRLTGEKAGNYKLPENLTYTYTVAKAKQTLEFKASATEVTYDENIIIDNKLKETSNYSTTVIYDSSNPKVVTVDNDGSSHVVGVGTATITATAVETENYERAQATWTVTVTPKPVTISGIKVENKTYNGTTAASIDLSNAKIDGGVSYTLQIDATNAKAVFKDANAGTDKTVIFTGFALTGADADNYTLSAQPANETADITPATITIIPETGKTKIYGAKDPELTYTYSGEISGEKPLFTGALGREAGENVGSYVINKGTLALMDNSDGKFSAGNYTLEVSNTPVNFVINRATPEIKVEEKTLVKNGNAVDISTWASFNNTDTDAKLVYTLVGAPAGISLTEDNLLTAENADTTAESFKIKVTADATANFTAPEEKQFTVQVVKKEDAGVKIDAPASKTYGDADFTLQASATAADNGTWSWTSSNEDILKIVSGADTAAPVIRVVKADATGATLTATYISDAYYGTASVTITVNPKTVTDAMIGEVESQEYNGGAIMPTPEVKDGEAILTPGGDFEFGYSDNTNAGTATLTITGKGNYTGIAEKKFTIKPKNIGSASIVLGGLSRPYTGEEQTVEIVSVTLPDGLDLMKNDDYRVVKGNTATDAAKEIVLTIEGKGNYTGTATTTWAITKAAPKLADFDVVPDLSNELTYSGEKQIVNVTTKAGIRGMGMITVRYNDSTEKPVNVGSYAITIDVADGSNYKAISGIEAGTLTIKKAAAPTLADVKVDHAYATTGNQTVSLADLVAGAIDYRLGEIEENETITGETVSENGVVTYTLTGKGAAGSTVTIPVTITSTNYEETTVNVVITIQQATPTGAPGYNFIHDSSKTLKDAGLDLINSTLNPKEGTLEWIDSNGKVLPGETKLEEGKKYIWRFTPDDPNYAVITGELELYAPYRILDGADSTWTQSTDGTIAIRGNGDFEKFQSVKVDGVVVDAKNYTVAKGSTIITFKEDYLKTLSTGSHTFELVWTDGSAATKFTIAAKPDNGDNNNDSNDDSDNDITVNGNVSSGNNTVPAAIGAPATGDPFGIWLTLFAISLTGLAGMLARRKKQ